MSQVDRSRKKIAVGTSDSWGRKSMCKKHRKGRKQAKNELSRDRRILDKLVVQES